MKAGPQTYLDACQSQNSCLLILEPLVNLVGRISIYVRLFHKRETDAIVKSAELFDLLVGSRLLPTKL
jgi:hypothetical protein